jgi:hypothetical protein
MWRNCFKKPTRLQTSCRFVLFLWSIWFIWLVSFNQTN